MQPNITQEPILAKVQAWVRPPLWRQAKSIAALNGQNNSEIVTEALELYVAKATEKGMAAA